MGRAPSLTRPPPPTTTHKKNRRDDAAPASLGQAGGGGGSGGATPGLWEYKTPEGEVRGPFSAARIVKWMDKDYFPPEMEVRVCACVREADEVRERGKKGGGGHGVFRAQRPCTL